MDHAIHGNGKSNKSSKKGSKVYWMNFMLYWFEKPSQKQIKTAPHNMLTTWPGSSSPFSTKTKNAAFSKSFREAHFTGTDNFDNATVNLLKTSLDVSTVDYIFSSAILFLFRNKISVLNQDMEFKRFKHFENLSIKPSLFCEFMKLQQNYNHAQYVQNFIRFIIISYSDLATTLTELLDLGTMQLIIRIRFYSKSDWRCIKRFWDVPVKYIYKKNLLKADGVKCSICVQNTSKKHDHNVRQKLWHPFRVI